MTDEEAHNQMLAYGIDAPCCCGGAMTKEVLEDAEEDIDYF